MKAIILLPMIALGVANLSPVKLVQAQAPVMSFHERWNDSIFAMRNNFTKRVVDEIEPVVVKTFPVSKQVEGMIPGAAPILPTQFTPVVKAAQPNAASGQIWPNPVKTKQAWPLTIRYRRTAALDICQRHGMHKQITRGGKSWRCRRG